MTDPKHKLNETEKHVFGADAKRHPVIGDLILEQGSGALGVEEQAQAFCANLARTDPVAAASWRHKLELAKRAQAIAFVENLARVDPDAAAAARRKLSIAKK
jgi:hypothetical protein